MTKSDSYEAETSKHSLWSLTLSLSAHPYYFLLNFGPQ
uniref:Uncharacterized protein n=1 Tax=Trichinella nativa TaxID=6335 RepID=A0A0V1KHF8_9BILA